MPRKPACVCVIALHGLHGHHCTTALIKTKSPLPKLERNPQPGLEWGMDGKGDPMGEENPPQKNGAPARCDWLRVSIEAAPHGSRLQGYKVAGLHLLEPCSCPPESEQSLAPPLSPAARRPSGGRALERGATPVHPVHPSSPSCPTPPESRPFVLATRAHTHKTGGNCSTCCASRFSLPATMRCGRRQARVMLVGGCVVS